MYRHMFQQVGLLSKRFGTMLTLKWFFPSVCTKVDLNVGLVKEGPVALGAMVHGLVITICVDPTK